MRSWILLGCAALACSFESSASSPSGMETLSGGSTTEATGSSTANVTDATDVSAGMSTGAGPTSEGMTEDSSEVTGASESSTTTGSVDPTLDPSTGGGDSPLCDESLVARYFLDEAAAGDSPMFAIDVAEEPLDLPLEYVQETMHYVQDLGHRGLAFDVAGADDGARASVEGSKFAGVEGITALTIEVVLRLEGAVGGEGSRVFHIGVGNNSAVALGTRTPDELEARWNGTVVRRWDYSAFASVTHVVHLVIDTSAASEDSQFRLLVDGGELDPVVVDSVSQGDGVELDPRAIVALGNRNQDRAIRGVLFYAALYGAAISDATIAQHVSALQESDDTPP